MENPYFIEKNILNEFYLVQCLIHSKYFACPDLL